MLEHVARENEIEFVICKGPGEILQIVDYIDAVKRKTIHSHAALLFPPTAAQIQTAEAAFRRSHTRRVPS